jgi:hypothetical protein
MTKNYNEEKFIRIVRQISIQKPAQASVVRQPKKVYCEMIWMGVKSTTIVRAVTADVTVYRNNSNKSKFDSGENKSRLNSGNACYPSFCLLVCYPYTSELKYTKL